jgi:ribosomal protein S18 acetylase RimI-like enzyme
MQSTRCTRDEDYAKVSLFLLANRRSLHPSFSTMDTIMMLYSYITDGHLIQVTDTDGRVIAMCAYYLGTPERDYVDQEVAFIDVAIVHPEHRGSRIFIVGLKYTFQSILAAHPEVREIRFAALSENKYVCKLYAKIAKFSHTREGSSGEETVFRAKVDEINAFLTKFYHV